MERTKSGLYFLRGRLSRAVFRLSGLSRVRDSAFSGAGRAGVAGGAGSYQIPAAGHGAVCGEWTFEHWGAYLS